MQTVSENLNVLVVEDNPADQVLLEQMLSSSRLRIAHIYFASTIAQAKDLLNTKEIQLLLLDLTLPDSFGIDSIKSLRNLAHRIPVIILTGLSDSETALEALKQNAQDYLVKGEFNSGLLTKSIEYSIERKKAEEDIIASEEKYREMFYQNPFPMWINDEDGLNVLEVNDAALQKYGYEREEFLKLGLNDIQVEEAHLSVNAMPDKKHRNLWKHRKKDGDVMVVEFIYYPINYFGKKAMQAQVNDITENLRLENELTLQKQQLIEAVLKAQENERKSIGRELHDNINQILTAVKLNLGLALEYRENNIPLIEKCEKNVETVMEEIRKISKELILPGNLKELGVVHSIEDLMKDVLHLTGIKWKLYAKAIDEALLSEDQKLTVYRIVQEQLNNILKHAEANLITIHLHTRESQIQLKITDDGKGFDPSQKRKGVGLTNIINRAELFSGSVKIDSAPGEGCSIEVILNPGVSPYTKLPTKDFLFIN